MFWPSQKNFIRQEIEKIYYFQFQGQEKPSDYLTYSEIRTLDDSSCQTAFPSFDQSHMICGGEVGVKL